MLLLLFVTVVVDAAISIPYLNKLQQSHTSNTTIKHSHLDIFVRIDFENEKLTPDSSEFCRLVNSKHLTTDKRLRLEEVHSV